MKKKFMFLLKVWAVTIAIGFALLFVVVILVGVGVMTGEVGAVVTQDECVRNGMTYRQVVACIGAEGTESMSIGSMVTYDWSNPNMTSAAVTFDSGRVSSKMALGGLP